MSIFENAYFGKPYRARGNFKVLFLRATTDGYYVLSEGAIKGYYIKCDGRCGDYILDYDKKYDVISEWKENN